MDINETMSWAQKNQEYIETKMVSPPYFNKQIAIIKVDFIVEEYTLKFVMESVNFEPQLT